MKLKKYLLLIVLCLLIAKVAAAETRALSKRYIPKLGTYVTFLGLGTVELGRDWGIDKDRSIHPSEFDSETMLRHIMEMRVGVVDTASSYQLSEQRIGEYIPQAEYGYLLITKAGEHSIIRSDPKCEIPSYDHIYCRIPGGEYDFSPEAIKDDVNESLKNLNVATIDVVLLHLDSKDAKQVLAKGDALKALYELKKEGKIRFVGVSINSEAALYAVKNLDIDVIELEYNLLNQTNEAAMELAHQKGIGVVVRGGLGTGLLTETVAEHINDPELPFKAQIKALLKLVNYDYRALTALELYFLYANPNISTVILGADSLDFMQLDFKLLNTFKQTQLVAQAKSVMATFPEPKEFTEIMGEYYAKDKE